MSSCGLRAFSQVAGECYGICAINMVTQSTLLCEFVVSNIAAFVRTLRSDAYFEAMAVYATAESCPYPTDALQQRLAFAARLIVSLQGERSAGDGRDLFNVLHHLEDDTDETLDVQGGVAFFALMNIFKYSLGLSADELCGVDQTMTWEKELIGSTTRLVGSIQERASVPSILIVNGLSPDRATPRLLQFMGKEFGLESACLRTQFGGHSEAGIMCDGVPWIINSQSSYDSFTLRTQLEWDSSKVRSEHPDLILDDTVYLRSDLHSHASTQQASVDLAYLNEIGARWVLSPLTDGATLKTAVIDAHKRVVNRMWVIRQEEHAEAQTAATAVIRAARDDVTRTHRETADRGVQRVTKAMSDIEDLKSQQRNLYTTSRHLVRKLYKDAQMRTNAARQAAVKKRWAFLPSFMMSTVENMSRRRADTSLDIGTGNKIRQIETTFGETWLDLSKKISAQIIVLKKEQVTSAAQATSHAKASAVSNALTREENAHEKERDQVLMTARQRAAAITNAARTLTRNNNRAVKKFEAYKSAGYLLTTGFHGELCRDGICEAWRQK